MRTRIAVALSIALAVTANVSAAVDWRTRGAVTPVRNMGQCGASWAFAATAALEGAMVAVIGSPLMSLSEQQLIDCSGTEGNLGCNGGTPDRAFQWIIKNGITSTTSYPYTARQVSCGKIVTPVVGMASFQEISPALATLTAAVDVQPVAVWLNLNSFDSYRSGIFPCSAGPHTTFATIVGYGSDATGAAYWIVKFAHTAEWGEKGYMRLARGATCSAIAKAWAPRPKAVP